MTSTEVIWQEYHARIRGFIASRIDDLSVVDDLLQEVFIKIHTRLDQLMDNERLGSWLFQITRNAINDYYRTRRPQQAFDETLLAEEQDSVERARRELEACFLPMIETLPDTYREAVRLSEIEGLTQQAVAERLGIGLSGAKSRVQRGRQLIRGMVESCCRLEFDHRGRLVDYDNKPNKHRFC